MAPVTTEPHGFWVRPGDSDINRPYGITWVYAHGYAGNPVFGATGRTDGTIAHDSMFGFLLDHPGDSLIVSGQPRPGHVKQHGHRLMRYARERGTPVVLVGLSRGGQVMNDIYRGRLHADGLVLISTPPTSKELAAPQRVLVQASRAIPASVGAWFAHRFGKLLAADGVKLAKELGREDLITELIEGAQESWWALGAAHALATYPGFGRPIAGDHVVVAHLPADKDGVVKVPQAKEKTLVSYPYAKLLTLEGVMAHGLPELGGYAGPFRYEIRPHFAHMFGFANK